MGFNSGFKGLMHVPSVSKSSKILLHMYFEVLVRVCIQTPVLRNLTPWNLVYRHKCFLTIFIFFFFRWRYSPLWALACRTIFLHFSLSPTFSIFSLPALEDLFLLLLSILSWVFLFVSSLPVLEWRSFLGILSFSILSRWPSQLILCPFIYFTVFSLLLKFLVLDSSYISIPHLYI